MTRFQSTHSLRSATRYDEETGDYDMFQSTHSLRSATALEDLDMISMWVSIHALLAECDRPRPRRTS